MKEDKYTKRWYWNRELDQEELVKRKMATGLPEAEAVSLVRPCTRRVKTVTTRLYWWKAADRFDIHFDIDGAEPSYQFWFIIPWLFGVAITLDCQWDWFKRKHPDIMVADSSKTWSLGTNRVYAWFNWGSLSDCMDSSSSRQGIRKIWDWVDILKGQNTGVTWSKAELVYEKEHRLRVVYRSDRHPTVPYYQPTRIRVYKKVGTWRFSRWFPTKHTRWEVECDKVFTMPGRGENSWDCGDETWGGYNFDVERQSCNFSCAADTAKAAAETFIVSFNRYQVRG